LPSMARWSGTWTNSILKAGTAVSPFEFNLRRCFVPGPVKEKIRASRTHYAARSFDEMWRQQDWRPEQCPAARNAGRKQASRQTSLPRTSSSHSAARHCAAIRTRAASQSNSSN
jgi:hypothetical protein